MIQLLDRSTLTIEDVGRTRGLTPEGFLLCRDVRIARTGAMAYAPFELPSINPGSSAMLTITRDADVLFAPEALASGEGKDVTLTHPDHLVSPETYRDSSVGVIYGLHRGSGADAEYLLADLLVKRADAIKAIQDGMAEVSLGYDCEYEQVRPGVGRQTGITINHVALVHRGRCGPSCAIGDEEMTAKSNATRSRVRDTGEIARRTKVATFFGTGFIAEREDDELVVYLITGDSVATSVIGDKMIAPFSPISNPMTAARFQAEVLNPLRKTAR